jgi:hypothetical protein
MMAIIFVAVFICSVKGFIKGVVERDRELLKSVFIFWGIIAAIVLWHFFMVADHIPEVPSVNRDIYGYSDPERE